MKLLLLLALVACDDRKPTAPAAPPPPPRPPPPAAYVANRATDALVAHHLEPSPPDKKEAWAGSYAGPLAMTRGFEGSMPYAFVVTATGDALVIEDVGVGRCTAQRSPANPNLAACRGSYGAGSIVVDFELAAAMHDGALALAMYTLDSTLAAQGHPEVTVPGTTAYGTLAREKP